MPRFAIAGFLFALVFSYANVAWAQNGVAPQAAQAGENAALTDQEQRDFDARLRAANTNDERARIEAEREQLIQVRIQRQGAVIPPSPRELTQDPIMPDVPTPPLDRPRPTGNTLPGGALSGTGAGTSPALNPGGLGGADGR
jgi:hypothetical protein